MKIIIFSLLTFASFSLPAQDYNLNDYKFRFQNYRYAYFNFNLSGNNDYRYNSSKYKGSFPNSNEIKNTNDRNIISSGINFPFYYSHIKNTDRLQHVENFASQVSYFNSGSKHEIQKQNSASFDYSNNNRIYNGLNFTEINISLGAGQNYYKYFNNEYSFSYRNSTQNNSMGNYNLSLGKGKGRLEYVTDAVTAMFLLNDLKKKAGIGTYSNEQIEQIARGITTIRNTRFIDYRYRLIDQLTLLDSTLKLNGITPNNMIRYFTTLNDNWLYATNFQRFSGSRWSVNYINNGQASFYNYRYRYSDTTGFSKQSNQNNSMYNGIEFKYDWSKQASLYIQRNFSARIGGGLNLYTDQFRRTYENDIFYITTNNAKPDVTRYYANFSYGYLFQPNTRTFITFNTDLNATLTNRTNGLRVANISELKLRELSVFLNPNLSIFKFFTPRFYYGASLTANCQLNHRYSKDINNEYDKSSNYALPVALNMGFTYTFY